MPLCFSTYVEYVYKDGAPPVTVEEQMLGSMFKELEADGQARLRCGLRKISRDENGRARLRGQMRQFAREQAKKQLTPVQQRLWRVEKLAEFLIKNAEKPPTEDTESNSSRRRDQDGEARLRDLMRQFARELKDDLTPTKSSRPGRVTFEVSN